jgi:hypothetical protein
MARPGRAKVVQAEPADDDDQPAAHLLYLVEVNSQEAAERFLDDILGIVDAAEHPKGKVDEVRAVLSPYLVDLRVPIFLAQRCSREDGLH